MFGFNYPKKSNTIFPPEMINFEKSGFNVAPVAQNDKVPKTLIDTVTHEQFQNFFLGWSRAFDEQ